MIKNYITYIKESSGYNISYVEKVINFLEKYFKDNNVEKYNIVSKTDLEKEKYKKINKLDDSGLQYSIELCSVFNGKKSRDYFTIYFNLEDIEIFGFEDKEIALYDDINDCISIIKKELDNFYIKYLKGYKELRPVLFSLPILNISKYLDTLEYIFINSKNRNLYIQNFINNFYNNEYFSDLKPLYDKRFKHIFNANKFDLL